MSNGEIKGVTLTKSTMTMTGGKTASITNNGTLSITSAQTGYITNSGTLTVNSGTIAGILSSGTTTIQNVSISVTSGYAIQMTAGKVTVNGGTVSSTGDYTVYASAGTFNYNGGTLKGKSTGKVYTYYLAAGVTFSMGDRSEYTRIESNQYVTTLHTAVAKIGSTSYNTLQAALNAGGTIVLQTNITNLGLTVGAGKTVTLNLNGKTMNNFISARVATTASSMSMITNAGDLTIYNGTLQTYNGNAKGITNNGTLSIGREAGTFVSSSPVIKAGALAVDNTAGKIFKYYDGVLESANNADVISTQRKDFYHRQGKHLEYTRSGVNKIELKDGSILEPLEYTIKVDENNLTIVVKQDEALNGTTEDIKIWLRATGVGEYAMSCSADRAATQKIVTCTTPVADLTYLYNSKYEKELLIEYGNYTTESFVTFVTLPNSKVTLFPTLSAKVNNSAFFFSNSVFNCWKIISFSSTNVERC
jgi:hypothetical protein